MALGRNRAARACIDLSDGLADALQQVTIASHVGARVLLPGRRRGRVLGDGLAAHAGGLLAARNRGGLPACTRIVAEARLEAAGNWNDFLKGLSTRYPARHPLNDTARERITRRLGAGDARHRAKVAQGGGSAPNVFKMKSQKKKN